MSYIAVLWNDGLAARRRGMLHIFVAIFDDFSLAEG